MKSTLMMVGVIAGGLLFGGARIFASKNSVVTAVFSSVSNGYERQKLPDGSFKREYYAIAQGHYVPGRDKNPSIDGVRFPSIAGLVAKHLAEQNYYLAHDSKSADILLLITWGTTSPFNDTAYKQAGNNFGEALNDLRRAQGGPGADRSVPTPYLGSPSGGSLQAAKDRFEQELTVMQTSNNDRFKASEANARLLGYVDEMNSLASPARFSGAGSYYDDLTSDLEEERYYVIISAYDFHAAVRDGTRKLLWATRVSISARSNKFDEQLAAMLAAAGRQFGQESHHLIRQYREGHIDLGELKFLGVVPDRAGPNQAPPTK